MAGKIFLSYRRDDSSSFARALFGRLEQSFPPERLLMDVEGGIWAGQDFVQVIEEQVDACDVMLVLIGPDWLTVTDEAGRRRLDNPDDFVRIEVESALRFGKRVIPVLVQKTEMPRADALPEPLKVLARRNAVGLTQERFKADAQGLIKALEGALAEAEESRRLAATEAVAPAKKRAAEEAAKAGEAAQGDKERARLDAIAGLSPEQIAKAEELANWEFVKASQTIEDFRDHLARFPQGVSGPWARAGLEGLVWSGLSRPVDSDALKGFLAEFPKGEHASEANAELVELEAGVAAAREAAVRPFRQERVEHLFICFSSGDLSEALSLVNELERQGQRCWISDRNVRFNHQREIVAAIRDASAILVVFSSNANTSDEMLKELTLASRYKIRTIPVRIENIEPTGAFEYELATTQFVDLFKWREAGIARLVGLVAPTE